MRHRVPATGTLQRNYFFEVRDGDFQRGINKAVANNWITVDLRNRYRYQLTTTGYAAGQVIDPVLGASEQGPPQSRTKDERTLQIRIDLDQGAEDWKSVQN